MSYAPSAKEIAALLSDAEFEDIQRLCQRYQDDPRQQVQKARQRALRRYERELQERNRVQDMYAYMYELGDNKNYIVGVDEVGRGAVAGPLTVAAVVLPKEPIIWGLNDSKQLTAPRREALAEQIRAHAVAYGIAHIPPQTIDRLGMAACLRQAMLEAIENTHVSADSVLIDGNPMHIHEKEKTIVKGDGCVACIAAASILAKVTRDALMVELSDSYPDYPFAQCKGYASAEHIEAIQKHGLSDMHRASFCGNFLANERLF